MDPYATFFNEAGRLRSGWRLGLYVILFASSMFLLDLAIRTIYIAGGPISGFAENVIFRVVLLGSAVFSGWLCNRTLEALPWRALGLSFHSGWFRDLLIGSVVGGMSLAIAALIAFAAGALRFSFSGREVLWSTFQALGTTAAMFIVAALAEEAAFRGYPLQTMTRAGLAWFGVLITSLPFALVHLQNPNVVAGFTFVNTALAGLWLAVAYLRTRSLWFPLGVHWTWNWALGSIFGLPVSGLKLSSYPVLQAVDRGPAWLTGGSYGIEGGLACTIALLVSTLIIWRTKLIAPTPEMKRLTSEENPVQR